MVEIRDIIDIINLSYKNIKDYLQDKSSSIEDRFLFSAEFLNRIGLLEDKAYLSIRFKVFMRDDFKCKYCGRSVKDGIKLEVDHIIPKSKNGKDEFENYITACYECNHGKRDILLELKQIKKLQNNKVLT